MFLPIFKTRVPLAHRQSHYDAVPFQTPMSIFSVVPIDKNIKYEDIYYSHSYRTEAIEKGWIGWGAGGKTWLSRDKFDLSEDEQMRYGMAFGLYYNFDDEAWRIGWHWPRFVLDNEDTGEPIWDKISTYSLVIDVIRTEDIKKIDAGTSESEEEDEQVIHTLYHYGITLVNDHTLYDEEDNLKTWHYYGIYDGVKGWYNFRRYDVRPHMLFEEVHIGLTSKPRSQARGVLMYEGMSQGDGAILSYVTVPYEGKSYILVFENDSGRVRTRFATPRDGITIAPDNQDGKLCLKNDKGNVSPYYFYGKEAVDPDKWKNMSMAEKVIYIKNCFRFVQI